jgi:hypothetical protein
MPELSNKPITNRVRESLPRSDISRTQLIALRIYT